MVSPKALQSVLNGFLGTFTSRYSDFNGYWLWGYLVGQPATFELDLLDVGQGADSSALSTAVALAAAKFNDQLAKHNLTPNLLNEARIQIKTMHGEVQGQVNSRICLGYQMHFAAHADWNNGRRYTSERRIFVAPHDASRELRSARAQSY